MSKYQRSKGLDDQWDGKQPRYMWFVFGKSEVGHTPSTTYTEITSPVPGVPTSDYQYQDITRTLSKYPHLFKIITPIHADHLEMLLNNHPNQPLVRLIDLLRPLTWFLALCQYWGPWLTTPWCSDMSKQHAQPWWGISYIPTTATGQGDWTCPVFWELWSKPAARDDSPTYFHHP